MDNNIGAKVDRDSLVEGGELLLKTEDEKADYGGDSKAQKMKQCCKVFVGVIAFILGLWVLAALSTPTCPSHIFGQTVEKLDVSKYAGEWYQMMVNKDQPFGGANSSCVRAIYSSNPFPRRVTVTNTGLTGKKPNQSLGGIQGYAEQAENGSGNITVRFPYVPRDGIYKVIDTDVGGKDAKGSYSIVYGCSHILGIKRVESVFILTRDKLVVGQAKWNDMQKKIFGIIKDKFSYTGGATNYWDPSWYTNTVQGEEFCDYSKHYKGVKPQE